MPLLPSYLKFEPVVTALVTIGNGSSLGIVAASGGGSSFGGDSSISPYSSTSRDIITNGVSSGILFIFTVSGLAFSSLLVDVVEPCIRDARGDSR